MPKLNFAAMAACMTAFCAASLADDSAIPRGSAELAGMGFLDVTAPPFSADPTGATDCTEALQRAIDHARTHCLAAFLPPGTYLVSDTLRCEQGHLGKRARTADAAFLALGFGIRDSPYGTGRPAMSMYGATGL